MPTAGSQFSRYKIPADLDPVGTCCISIAVPDDPEWQAQFFGAIYRMSIQSHYERDSAHSGTIVASRWREIWSEAQSMGCCTDTIDSAIAQTQINIQTQIYLDTLMQIYLAAGSDIDVAWPATPDDFDADPGDAGPEIAQRNRALCLTIASWVDELLNRGISLARDAGVEISGGVAAGILIPLLPAKIVMGGFIAAVLVLSELVVQMASTPYREYLKCGMFTALKGEDTNSPTAFAEAWDNLPSRPPPPQSVLQDIARDAIEAWGRSQLNNLDNYLGFISTLNVAMGASVSYTDDDCPCLTVELEINPGITFTTPMVLEKLVGTLWRVTAGVWTHPTSGATDIISVVRDGGGCFDITNSVLISGSLTSTSWTPCGGGSASNFPPGSPTPDDRPNIEAYALQDPGQTDGFVVEFNATLP